MVLLHELFSKYDALCVRHNVFKVETIGGARAHVCGGGARTWAVLSLQRASTLEGRTLTLIIQGTPALSHAPCHASLPRADCYMACTGLLEASPVHAHQLVEFAVDMLAAAASVRNPLTGAPLQVRIGVDGGEGVQGKKRGGRRGVWWGTVTRRPREGRARRTARA